MTKTHVVEDVNHDEDRHAQVELPEQHVKIQPHSVVLTVAARSYFLILEHLLGHEFLLYCFGEVERKLVLQ